MYNQSWFQNPPKKQQLVTKIKVRKPFIVTFVSSFKIFFTFISYILKFCVLFQVTKDRVGQSTLGPFPDQEEGLRRNLTKERKIVNRPSLSKRRHVQDSERRVGVTTLVLTTFGINTVRTEDTEGVRSKTQVSTPVFCL